MITTSIANGTPTTVKNTTLANGNYDKLEQISIAADGELNIIASESDVFLYILNGEGDLFVGKSRQTIIPGEHIKIKEGVGFMIKANTNFRMLVLH